MKYKLFKRGHDAPGILTDDMRDNMSDLRIAEYGDYILVPYEDGISRINIEEYAGEQGLKVLITEDDQNDRFVVRCIDKEKSLEGRVYEVIRGAGKPVTRSYILRKVRPERAGAVKLALMNLYMAEKIYEIKQPTEGRARFIYGLVDKEQPWRRPVNT